MKAALRCMIGLTLLLVPTLARSQIANGDFTLGGTGWNTSLPNGWTATFPATGGNPGGYALIRSLLVGETSGRGCVTQEFTCGVPGSPGVCVVRFDYRLQNLNAFPMSGRAVVVIDGIPVFTSPLADQIPWTSQNVTVGCGLHAISLCLDVDLGPNGYEAGYDNVSAMCELPVSTDRSTWGTIKALYRL